MGLGYTAQVRQTLTLYRCRDDPKCLERCKSAKSIDEIKDCLEQVYSTSV